VFLLAGNRQPCHRLVKEPWNLERTPGGSSGGESAAIAAGLSPLGCGSDVAISVRGPAALTGIVGLKATHGRIPFTGHFPQHELNRYFHIGPLARSVRDIATAYSIMQGPDGIDGLATHSRDAGPSNPSGAGKAVRVGWLVSPGFGPVDPEVAAAVSAAGGFLKDVGCEVEPVHIPFLAENNDTALFCTARNWDARFALWWATDRMNYMSSVNFTMTSRTRLSRTTLTPRRQSIG
jgi:Asp-tRNA(Asn)/Glu-tRNA(Gln) amidotransferase A subunit family amidase